MGGYQEDLEAVSELRADAIIDWGRDRLKPLEPEKEAQFETLLTALKEIQEESRHTSSEGDNTTLELRLAFGSAILLKDLGYPSKTFVGSIAYGYHRLINFDLEKVKRLCGGNCSALIRDIDRINSVFVLSSNSKNDLDHEQIDKIRKSLLAIVRNTEAVIIKLANQLVLLFNLRSGSEEEQQRVAKITQDIFTPLANCLGLYQLKWLLEDYSFRYLSPLEYREIAKGLAEKRSDREKRVKAIIKRIEKGLADLGIKGRVIGRAKHIFSIREKMRKKRLSLTEVFDSIAVRVITTDIASCYQILTMIHTIWQPIEKEFDDYIIAPKRNGYRSIHTSLISKEDGKIFEIQIRTKEMDEHAEKGIAAHWAYKEHGPLAESGHIRKISWLQNLLDWQKKVSGSGSLGSNLEEAVFKEQIYVFTPNGRIIDLPAGATGLDFAYHVHTDVGHKCVGVKVEGHLRPLTFKLKTGNTIEVLTNKNAKPSRDWLRPDAGYLTTHRARSKVALWFRRFDSEGGNKGTAVSKPITVNVLRNLLKDSGLEVTQEELGDLAILFGLSRKEELCENIKHGKIKLSEIQKKWQTRKLAERQEQVEQKGKGEVESRSAILLDGDSSLLTSLAKCCSPLPGDDIEGYVTRGKGITIHRKNCYNFRKLKIRHRDKCVMPSWSKKKKRYIVGLELVIVHDQVDRILGRIQELLISEKTANTPLRRSEKKMNNFAKIRTTIQVADLSDFNRLAERIKRLGANEINRF